MNKNNINIPSENENNDFSYEESLFDINKSNIRFNAFGYPFPPFKEDSFQNDTQYSSLRYFKSNEEKPPLANNNNKEIKDDMNFQKEKIESE